MSSILENNNVSQGLTLARLGALADAIGSFDSGNWFESFEIKRALVQLIHDDQLGMEERALVLTKIQDSGHAALIELLNDAFAEATAISLAEKKIGELEDKYKGDPFGFLKGFNIIMRSQLKSGYESAQRIGRSMLKLFLKSSLEYDMKFDLIRDVMALEAYKGIVGAHLIDVLSGSSSKDILCYISGLIEHQLLTAEQTQRLLSWVQKTPEVADVDRDTFIETMFSFMD